MINPELLKKKPQFMINAGFICHRNGPQNTYDLRVQIKTRNTLADGLTKTMVFYKETRDLRFLTCLAGLSNAADTANTSLGEPNLHIE